jgi:tetratricopeptide (TPR) repeat protein
MLSVVGLAFVGVALNAATVTFARDIAPIVFEHCASCHRPGQAAPFSLLTYDEVRRRAQLIAVVTKSRSMPPWKPEPGYGEFAGERRLSDRQVELIQQWVELGTPEGDVHDLPPTPQWVGDWQLGKPDLVVSMPEPYLLGSDGPDVFRTFVIPIEVPTGRFVKGLEFHPGVPRAVHHANVKIDRTRSSRRLDDDDPGPGFDGGGGRGALFPDGHFLGWTPGQAPHMLDDTAWWLEVGSDLVVEVHMMPTGKPERVQLRVGLFFTDDPPLRVPYMVRLGRQSIDIPAGTRDYRVTDSYVLPVDVEVLSVQPHAHNLAREMKGFARLPDGTTTSLIYIRDWDFRWQDVYRFRRPISLPRGTTLTMQYTYDNSADNIRNPNRPPKRVTFGQTTASEMGDLWLQLAARTSSDRAALDVDYAPKMLQEDIAGDEKALEINPNAARLHADLAFCYLAAGRTAEAIVQLEEAVRLEPSSAHAQYDLGTTLLKQKRLDDAAEHFDRALRLKPDFSEAYNNRGAVQALQGRTDEAIASYTEAVRLNAANVEARDNLASALVTRASLLAQRNRIDEAIVHYRRALQLNADLPAALVDLAWILATSERHDVRAPDEAVRLAEHAAQVTKQQDALVLDTLAVTYFSASRLDRAISTAQAALDLASTTGRDDLAADIRRRLESFKRERW